MKESNASLETSKPEIQSNSKTDNNVSPINKGEPNKTAATNNEPAKPRTLADLFADKSNQDSLEINVEEQEDDDPNAPVDSIDRLKRRNKLSDEQVYAIKVPMPNGAEPLTIGELKDRIGEVVDLDMRQVEFDERRIKQEGELVKAQTELRGILQMLPKEAITPQVLGKLRDMQEATTAREKQLTVKHIPSWTDEKKRNADIQLMQSRLALYGFDESFLHTVTDHRAIKFIRDHVLMAERIRKSIEQVRDPQKLNGRPSGKTGKAPVKPGANTARKTTPTQNDKLAKIFEE